MAGKRSDNGFTLVELLIALAVTGILMIAVYGIYTAFYKQTASQDLLVEAQQSARAGIEFMHRELVQLGHKVPTGTDPIVSASANSIAFRYSELNQESGAYVNYMVTYDVANVSGVFALRRKRCEQNAAWSGCVDPDFRRVVDNLNGAGGLVLSYYDFEGTPVPSPVSEANLARIRFVKATLTTVTKTKLPTTGLTKTVTVTTEARLRNLFATASETADEEVPAQPGGPGVREVKLGSRIGICGRLNLRWLKGTEPDLAGYGILYSVGGIAAPVVKVALSRLTTDGTYYYYTLAPTGENALQSTPSNAGPITYTIDIRAYDNSGNFSTSSVSVSGNPDPSNWDFNVAGDDTTINPAKPAPVTGFKGTDGANVGEVLLDWTAYDLTNNPDVVGFRIYRSTQPFAAFPITTGANITLIAAETAMEGVQVLGKAATSLIDKDVNLVGCQTYFYAIAPVICDTALITDDGGDPASKRYVAADYTATCGDGTGSSCVPGTGMPAVTNSDTAPRDDTPPPVPTVTPAAGWKAVFLDIVNPVREGVGSTPDFSHTLVYFDEGGSCPTVDTTIGSPTYGDISNGFALPNSDSGTRGRFTTSGVVPPFPHLDDDCIFEDCRDMPLNGTVRNLENASTYCYLGVAYDVCGNPRPIANAVTTLTELCGDDPAGPPGNGTKGGEVWPTGGTPISVAGCQAGGGLDVSWSTMNHTYPNGYYDGAFYKVHMKTGDGDFSGINPSSEITLKAQKQAELATSMTFSTGPIVSGVSDGQSYYFGVTATDCVYENDTANFPLNYSGWRTIGPIAPGELLRDEKCPGGGTCEKDLHREILTGVTINADNTTQPRISPSSDAYHHNTVTLFLDNTSAKVDADCSGNKAGCMTIERLTVIWDEPAARLTNVSIGGGRTGLPVRSTNLPSVVSGTDNDITDASIPGGKRYVPITLEFKDASGNPIGMREKNLRITLAVKNESTATTGCVSYLTISKNLGDINIPYGPVVFNMTQDQPSWGTSPYMSPGVDGLNIPPSGSDIPGYAAIANWWVYVAADVVSRTLGADGNPIPISSAVIYYKATENTVTTPPTDYENYQQSWMWNWGNQWYGWIPPKDGKRVWYYVVAVDSDGNFERSPKIEYGAYVYDQKSVDLCSVTPDRPWINTWDPLKTFADPVSNTVALSWWPVWGYVNPWAPKYDSDTFKYRVYRKEGFGAGFDPHRITAGGCSGDLECPGWECSCVDNDPALDVMNQDNSYYIRTINGCENKPACETAAIPCLGEASNMFTECKGVGGGSVLTSVTPWSSPLYSDWGGFTITVNKCSAAGNGTSWETIGNVNVASTTKDADIISVWEDGDTGTFMGWMQLTTDAGWNSSSDQWYVLVDKTDTVTVSLQEGDPLAHVPGSPKTLAVVSNPCADIPKAPTFLNGVVDASKKKITLTWGAVTQNTDGTAITDLAGYKVFERVCVTGTGPDCAGANLIKDYGSTPITTTTALTATLASDMSANFSSYDYVFKVMAYDSCSNNSPEPNPYYKETK